MGTGSARGGMTILAVHDLVGTVGCLAEPLLHHSSAMLHHRFVCIRRYHDGIAGYDSNAPERQVDHRPIPVVQHKTPAGRNGDRIDWSLRESRQLAYTKPGNARDFRNVGRQRHVVSLREGGQHGLECADATLDVETAAVIARSSHWVDAETLRRVGIDLAVAMARNQDLDPMPAAEERHHKMLPVPHGDDNRLL